MARASDSFFILALFRDKSFQMRLIRRVLMLAGIFIVVSTVMLGIFYHHLLGEIVAGTSPMLFASDELARLNEQVPGLTTVLGRWLVAMLVINAVLTTVIGVFISRKLGSPLMAIRRALNEISEGNLDVQLRAGDSREFAEISDALNSAVATIQEKIGEAQRQVSIVEKGGPQSEHADIREALQNCHGVLQYFNTGERDNAAA